MSTLLISFHGGTKFDGGKKEGSINNLIAAAGSSLSGPMLLPNPQMVLPALCELRDFTVDANNNLYVLNSYKPFSQILTFSPSSGAASGWTFSGIFAEGTESQLSHPFSCVLGVDGHLYVSNQDTNAITRYEGLGMKHPGKLKGVFADGFAALRGIATDGNFWYVADEGDGGENGSGEVCIYDNAGKKQSKSLDVKTPVHLLYDGVRYLYIGSESENTVYSYDTQSSSNKVVAYIQCTTDVPINHTAGLALSGNNFYVASRCGFAINQYQTNFSPPKGSVLIANLSDNPEFVAVQ
jgi:hypothetical protein